MLKFLRVSIFFLSFFLLCSISGYSTSLENIPLDSWVYSSIEELYTQGLFPELIKGHLVSDIVAVLGSLNIIAAELDR